VRIAVTGASGRLGRLVTAELLRRVSADQLILISRSRLPAVSGVAVRYGDFDRPETLPDAFQGADRALVISTLGSRDAVAAHRAAFENAARAGVGHIVYTSVLNPVPGNPFPPAAAQLHSEADLAATGVAWTVLRNALYADLRADIAPHYARAGRWVTNIGAGAHAFVTRADCSAAAAAVLTGDGHEGHRYDITGPQLIDATGFLALVNRLADQPVERIDVDDEAYERYRTGFMTDPANTGTFELFTGTGKAIRTGWLDALSDDVHRLTGRTPTALQSMPPFAQ
jgi:NAD(P)H dehydrogenase (quinone)